MHSIEYYESQKQDNFLLLRIIAACMVIYGHSFAITQDVGLQDIFLKYNWGRYSGDIAVSMFFVISGFMVSGSFIKRSDAFDYFVARFLRIIPGLFLLLILCVFVIGPIVTNHNLADYFKNIETYKYIIKNLSFSSNLSWTLPGVFDSQRRDTINGSLWTLSPEMRMYFFIALLGVFGFLRHRFFCLILFVSLICAALLNPKLLPLHEGWIKVAGFFCVGVFLQLYKEKVQIKHEVIFGLIFLTYICRLTDGYFYLLAISIAYFCFWFAYKTPHLKIEKYGDPSYGIYLWGWPIQQLTVWIWPNISPAKNCIISLFFAILAGYLSWHLIEKQALKLKRRVVNIRKRFSSTDDNNSTVAE